MKSSQWQILDGAKGHRLAKGLYPAMRRLLAARPSSRNTQRSLAFLRGRGVIKPPQVLCAGLLLVAVLGVAYASGGSQNGPQAQISTSLNGPGNVYLTANVYGSGGTGTVHVAIADFNGDGKLDYVTANPGNNTIGVALGNGDGTFKTPSSIAVACNPISVAIGDFNGDGKPDLAVSTDGCSPGTNGVAILLGNGDGTFTANGKLTSPLSNPISAVIGDFNGDGKMDLAVVDRGVSTDAVFFYAGNGDGTFQAPTSVGLGGLLNSNQIVAADFNKDGHLDVAVSEINGSNVVVILGNGNGTFQAPRNVALPAQGWGLAVGDFNGDGVPDLVATSPAIGGVSVFLGKGDGNFTPVNNPATGTLPTTNAAASNAGAQAIAVGDFNKDGKLDVIAALSGVNGAPTIAVLPGNGDGTFQPQLLFGTADMPVAIAVADFDSDGNLDWITANNQTSDVVVGLGRGNGTFLAAREFVVGNNPQQVAIADFNRDGKLDLVTANLSSNDISILLGNGDGTFQLPATLSIAGTVPVGVVTGDFNGDGIADFIALNGPGGFVAPCLGTQLNCLSVFLGKGDGTFQAPTVISTGSSNVNQIITGDFNGDGKLDIAFGAGPNGNPVSVGILLGNGDGTFNILTPVSTGATSIAQLKTADLNKDGKLDLVVTDVQSGTQSQVQILLGNGDGTFQAPTNLTSGRFTGTFVIADFNGDGNLDILASNELDANAEIWLGNGNGTFNSPNLLNTGGASGVYPRGIVAGDFNLDGHLDVAFTHGVNLDPSGNPHGVGLLLGNGDGTFQAPEEYLLGRSALVYAAADLNRDGAPDLVIIDTGLINVLLNQTPPPVTVSPSSLSFGNQLVGSTSSALVVKVSNNGTVATTIAVAASGDYAQTNNCPVSPVTLAPAASCNINVTFTPTATGVRTGAVTVSDTLPGSPQTVTLTGTGIAPAVTLSGTSLSFGNQIVGTSSAAQMVTLSNTGTATLTISSIAVAGTNSGDFSQTNTCGASVAAGANCSISVIFKPTATGGRAASVTITDNASGSPQSISLSGTGVAPAVSFGGTTSLTFSGQPVGTTSAPQSVTLTNTGNAALTINSIAITGANSGDFSETNTCPASPSTLAAGANCSIAVTLKPTAIGTRNASLSVADNAGGSPQSVSLTGTGVAAAPVVSLAPTSLSFGNQLVGTSSSAQSVTLTNTGNATLTFSGSGITITGTNSGDFSQTNTCGASVAAGANCTISVTFKPTATGSRSASVSITDNAAGSPQSIPLSGTGTAPVVSFGSTTSLNFGNQLVGTSSSAQTVTLTNTGTGTLTFSGSGITINGANSGDFSETNTCGSSVAAGANCTISITFKPTATGARNASLSVTDNASGSPQSISLTGTGVAPVVTLSPTSLTFAGQLITTTSAAQTITLTNSGTGPLTISSIATSGTNNGDFAQTNTCPASSATLAANANCTISVTFTPSATGSRTASLTITDNASGSPHTVSLTGTGTDYSLAAASGANCPAGSNCSTSATVTAGQTATYDLQVSPSNGFNGSVVLACTGSPGNSTCAISPASVPPAGSTSYAFSVTVNNTANVMFVPQPPFQGVPGLPNSYALLIFAVLLVMFWAARGTSDRFARRCLVPAMAVLFFCVLYSAGCGGGGGGPVTPPPTNAVLKVTGTSSGINRTVSLNLTVNH